MALRVHCPDTFVIEPSFSTSVDTSVLGSGDPLALALFDEPPLHLGDHTKHGEHDVAEFPPR